MNTIKSPTHTKKEIGLNIDNLTRTKSDEPKTTPRNVNMSMPNTFESNNTYVNNMREFE